MSTPPPPSGQTGIEVTATFNFLLWILNFLKPVVTIDGQPTTGKWKQPMFFPTAPGDHQLQVDFKYFFLKHAGKAVTTASVAPGQVTRLSYKAPWIIYLHGKIKPV
ncbi:MAG TPA: hypothetical protein VGM78_06735 [Ilumatobacteraceae bacterium]